MKIHGPNGWSIRPRDAGSFEDVREDTPLERGTQASYGMTTAYALWAFMEMVIRPRLGMQDSSLQHGMIGKRAGRSSFHSIGARSIQGY